MLKKSWRRFTSPAVWAFAIVLGAPMLAEAQQGGLFPLAPIRRERIPCPMEDPVFRLYRQEYYGYHPTWWRRFPPGWGFPSPEAPNVAAAFDPNQGGRVRDKALIAPPDEMEGGLGAPGGMEGPPPSGERGRGALPPLPAEERSPFELDTRPQGGPPAGPGERPAPPPAGNNPLDLPPPAETPGGAGTAPGLGSATPPTLLEAPADAAAGERPLLALPDPASPSVPSAPSAPSAASAPPSVMMPGTGVSTYPVSSAPVLAPRRTSLLGGFFNGLRRR